MKNRTTWLNHLFNFFAVILGVYLAFIINQRAITNAERAEVQLLMQALLTDLNGDIETYNRYVIPVNEQRAEALSELIEELSQPRVGDISELLGGLLELDNFALTSTTYQSMVASGKIRLIDDLALQRMLSKHYDSLGLESIRKGEFQVEYFSDHLLPWLVANVDFMTMEPLELDELVQLRNKVLIYQSLIYQKTESYKDITTQSAELIDYIETTFGLSSSP